MVSISLATSSSSTHLPPKPFKLRPPPPPPPPSPLPLLHSSTLTPTPTPTPTPSLKLPNPNPNPNHKPNPLSSKLGLSSKLSPPPAPPPPPTPPPQLPKTPPPDPTCQPQPASPRIPEFRQKGKIFVGNLPLWAKKSDIANFFRQFGELDKVVLIRGHDDPERNVGYCFVYYSGTNSEAEAAAVKAVEVDGVEFHGRVLTVRLDDGRRRKERAEERDRWARGLVDGKTPRSPWHEAREKACFDLRRVVESQPGNWQAVVSAFEKIPKVVTLWFNFCMKIVGFFFF